MKHIFKVIITSALVGIQVNLNAQDIKYFNDLKSIGGVITDSIDDVYEIKYLNHIVTLEKERLSIKRGVYYEVWGGKEPPKKDPRMEYTYHWTESGFVLDSVKPL